jgi:hypothetical protein
VHAGIVEVHDLRAILRGVARSPPLRWPSDLPPGNSAGQPPVAVLHDDGSPVPPVG